MPLPPTRPRLAVLLGPTASGKTTLGVRLARRLGAEILSADSLQVYRRFDIGSAKPTVEERDGVPHHLIDVLDPHEYFSAADFSRRARVVVERNAARGVPTLLVGGTGLYIRALLEGLFEGDNFQPEVRARLRERLEAEGLAALHAELARRDPAAAARIHSNDPQRTIRALEVIESTGRPLSVQQAAHGFTDRPFRTLKIGLAWEIGALRERIHARVDAMRRAGLVGEVRALLAEGVGRDLKPMKAIGYKEPAAFLSGEMDESTMWEAIRTGTRQLAKRQRTWFRADAEIAWKPVAAEEEMFHRMREFFEAPAGGSDDGMAPS